MSSIPSQISPLHNPGEEKKSLELCNDRGLHLKCSSWILQEKEINGLCTNSWSMSTRAILYSFSKRNNNRPGRFLPQKLADQLCMTRRINRVHTNELDLQWARSNPDVRNQRLGKAGVRNTRGSGDSTP